MHQPGPYIPRVFCDLHLHSTASDGTTPPDRLAAEARAAGVAAIALTDHDTTVGLPACAEACRHADVAFVPGIEISADPSAVLPPGASGQEDEPPWGTLHLLGLFIDPASEGLAAIRRKMTDARAQRNPAIIERLQQLGLRIDYVEVEALAAEQGTTIIGRPHIAQVMLRKGYVKSVQDAFRRYIGQGAAAYVRRDRLDPQHAIDAIHGAGGLAGLAHPVQLKCRDDEQLERYVRGLAAMGLDALEVWHSDHRPADIELLTHLADRLDLAVTGGSDYHGQRKAIALGSQRVPMSVYEALHERWRCRVSA
jgi:hypothetical protein